MAKQVINIGTIANDGTGDLIRDSFDKTNDNFTELYDSSITIAGVKTFSSFPVTPSSAPTTDYQVANKKYVDDNAAAPDYTLGTLAWADVSAESATQYSTMQQVTGINVPTPVLLIKDTDSEFFSIWCNTSNSWTGAKEVNVGTILNVSYSIITLFPGIYYGFKTTSMAAGNTLTITIVKMNDLSTLDSMTFTYPGGAPP